MQAGCRIAELADALRQHGLTLVNYASIREQAVGGFVQVALCRGHLHWLVQRPVHFQGIMRVRFSVGSDLGSGVGGSWPG